MQVQRSAMAGVAVLETDRHGDARGSFARWFCENELADVLGGSVIRQINHSHSAQMGTVRGLHFQYSPYAEKKIVRCLVGRVFDVVVDLRAGSATFLQWQAVELSADNHKALLIPEGCAHGFQTLTDDVQLLYLHTAPYTPEAESAVAYNDPCINIAWPLAVSVVSDRDKQHAHLPVDFPGITL
ncbi:dTDP-4-dehydrorhamnose 3,5-epimerase [Iodobacter sp. CM08]|uniref:dTDP-4-dehydrorhamnose 3,5-epimerase n=1 Tax=Iodobacter sp. CM08 TaxID=3085902 RepID=UPI00298202B6|nr:dTDP-4-dehydrorhamnose 3,5-epimerase [Iodobacter sp. CM08]MDW5417299.1 dTDP-4-dehydrorhamnose 3,5-epimerase [Iodobacter sp. CM08]